MGRAPAPRGPHRRFRSQGIRSSMASSQFRFPQLLPGCAPLSRRLSVGASLRLDMVTAAERPPGHRSRSGEFHSLDTSVSLGRSALVLASTTGGKAPLASAESGTLALHRVL